MGTPGELGQVGDALKGCGLQGVREKQNFD
jgi:hypothetical protein